MIEFEIYKSNAMTNLLKFRSIRFLIRGDSWQDKILED